MAQTKNTYYMLGVILVTGILMTACTTNNGTPPNIIPNSNAQVPIDPNSPQDDVNENNMREPNPNQVPETITEPENSELLDPQGEFGISGNNKKLDTEIKKIICDKKTRTITFTLNNKGVYDLHLNQDAPFTGTTQRNIRVFINNYEVKSTAPQFHPINGKLMFGPNEKLGDNCDSDIIKRGESVTCTLENVRLTNEEESNEYVGLLNQMYLDTPGNDASIEFFC